MDRDYSYYTDMVFCVDVTARMAPVLEEVKSRILSMCSAYLDAMYELDDEVSALRVKIISFRDYAVDAEPMVDSRFFDYFTEKDELSAYVSSLCAKGGTGEGACALEALALAMRSDFTTGHLFERQLITLFSNGSALRLGLRSNYPSYPDGMPRDLNELGFWWYNNGRDETWRGYDATPPSIRYGKNRLVAFVPQCYPWRLLESWGLYWPAYSEKGASVGLYEVDMASVIDLFTASDL